jgi:opacity protein-like surface antigen
MAAMRIVLCLLLTGLCLTSVYGQDEEGDLLSFLDDWEFKITHYFWWADADGDITASEQVEAFRFDSPVELSDLGGISQFEAWRGDWGFAGYWLAADFEEDFESDGVGVEATLEPWVIHVGFGYRFAEIPLGGREKPDWLRNVSMYVTGGLRYWDVETEVDFDDGRTIAADEGWVEPFISGRITLRPMEKLILGVNLGVGGFGIGSSDDVSWSLSAGVEYLFSKTISVSLGYAAFDANFTAEAGSEQIDIDTELAGPALALIFRF